MSSSYILLAELDKGKPTPRAIYRNSGCGPREVFRTPELGRKIDFDIGEVLARWEPTARDTKIRGTLDVRRGARIAAETIERVTDVALEALSVPSAIPSGRQSTTVAQRATHNLDRLATVLKQRQTLSYLVGIAQDVAAPERDLSRTSYAGREAVNPLQVATTLVAASVFAPPLLLWDRAPSFTWWRLDRIIVLRVFGRSQDDLFHSRETI